jgi:PEP-CTERM motif
MKVLLGVAASIALSFGVAHADVLTYNFGSATGNLGQSHTYTQDALSIIAGAFGPGIIGGPADALFGKNNGGDEIGLGMTNDSFGENEIMAGKGFVQIDVSALFGLVDPLSALFSMNSTTGGELWRVFGTNTAGTIGSGILPVGAALLISGTDEASHGLPSFGTYKYYDFISSLSGPDGANVLLHNLVVTTSVPEPATWALMILGFFGLAFARRRLAAAA